jgi:hypothetical protein
MGRKHDRKGDDVIFIPRRPRAPANIKPSPPPSNPAPCPETHDEAKPAWPVLQGHETGDLSSNENKVEAIAEKAEPPVFHRLKSSDPRLGNLGVLPDELVSEICKHLVPPEVPGTLFKGQFKFFYGKRNNVLSVMQASSRFYSIMRELKCLRERTYHFGISARGCAFEGRLRCPSRIIEWAMQHMEAVKVTLEIDLDQLRELSYLYLIGECCCKVACLLQHLQCTERPLQAYEVDICFFDSNFVPGRPFRRRVRLANGLFSEWEGHVVKIDDMVRFLIKDLATVQNIRCGSMRILSHPLTYHGQWNCSMCPVKPTEAASAMERWRQVQEVVDAGSYLLSGWDEKELKSCVDFLGMRNFRGYYTRMECMRKLERLDSQGQSSNQNEGKKTCRCPVSHFRV